MDKNKNDNFNNLKTAEDVTEWYDMEEKTKRLYGISMGDLVREFKNLQQRVEKLETPTAKPASKPTTWTRGSQFGH